MDTVKLVEGDQLPTLRFTLKDSSLGTPCKPATWPALDLTGAVVSIRVINRATRVVTGTMDVFVDDPTNGAGYAEWGTTLTGPGEYDAEITVDFGGKRLTVYDMVPVHVRQKD